MTGFEGADGVAVLHWPGDEEQRLRLQRSCRPRLLLVEPGTPVPVVLDRLEDWAFATADELELQIRAETLAARSEVPVDSRPMFDGSNLLRFDGRWISLPAGEERIVRLLVDRFEECVSRAELEQHATTPGSCSLNSSIKRIRNRLAPLGLSISTLHGRGYVLGRRGLDVTGASERVRRR